MAFAFKKTVSWPNNDLLLPAGLFGVTVPPGLTGLNIRAPNYVDVHGMQAARRSNSPSAGVTLSMVGGLVTSSISLRFADPVQQWPSSPVSGGTTTQGPAYFHFAGGDVFLDLNLGVYILNPYRPRTDPISVELFSVVYSHELLHVLDEINIFKNWLLSRLAALPHVSRYLIRQERFPFGRRGQPIEQVRAEFRTHIHSRIETEIWNVWATEHNRRQAIRDSPAEYQEVQNQIDALRIRQVN